MGPFPQLRGGDSSRAWERFPRPGPSSLVDRRECSASPPPHPLDATAWGGVVGGGVEALKGAAASSLDACRASGRELEGGEGRQMGA